MKHRRIAQPKRNVPRAKVPYRIWVVSWGYRYYDPAIVYAFDGDWSKRDVEKRADMLINQWISEEREAYESGGEADFDEGDIEINGPFSESYIKTVKGMTTRERKEFETDLNFYGESPLTGRSF